MLLATVSDTMGGALVSPNQTSADSAQNSPTPSTASPEQIAGALIRFMSKGKGESTSKRGLSDSKGLSDPKLAVNPQLAAVAPSPAIAPGVGPLTKTGGNSQSVNSVGPQSPDSNPAGPGAGARALLPGTTAADSNTKAANSQAQIAFEMQLTPANGQTPVEVPGLANPQIGTDPASSMTPPESPEQASPEVPAASEAVISRAPDSSTSNQPLLSADQNQAQRNQAENLAGKNQSGKDQSGKDQEDTGSQPKPRDQVPDKNSAVASAGPAGTPAQTTAFPGGVIHTVALAPSAPGSSPTAKNPASAGIMDPPSTPLADIKDSNPSPPVRPGETQQIDVRIAQPQAPPVDLQVAQRSGQIQVVVRTGDPVLETALRQDLGTLVHSLERSGFHAEAFVPMGAASASESRGMNAQADPRQAHPGFSGNGSSGQNGGQKGGRGSGGHSRGDDSSEPQQSEVWANPLEGPLEGEQQS
jgi:hypothetical protein